MGAFSHSIHPFHLLLREKDGSGGHYLTVPAVWCRAIAVWHRSSSSLWRTISGYLFYSSTLLFLCYGSIPSTTSRASCSLHSCTRYISARDRLPAHKHQMAL